MVYQTIEYGFLKANVFLILSRFFIACVEAELCNKYSKKGSFVGKGSLFLAAVFSVVICLLSIIAHGC
jgi:hypothetical protein